MTRRAAAPIHRARTLCGALALAAALLLAACAGAPDIGGIPSCAVSLNRSSAEAMVSAYRRQHGLGPVVLDPRLVAVAQRQADAMASLNQLGHEIAGALPQRLAAGGVDGAAAIENVSFGYGSFPAALEGWKRSPQHNDNLLFGPMRRMGVAAAAAPGSRTRTYWSLVMTD